MNRNHILCSVLLGSLLGCSVVEQDLTDLLGEQRSKLQEQLGDEEFAAIQFIVENGREAGFQEFRRLCVAGDFEAAEVLGEYLTSVTPSHPVDFLKVAVAPEKARMVGRVATGMDLVDWNDPSRVSIGKHPFIEAGLGLGEVQNDAVESAEERFQAVRSLDSGKLRLDAIYSQGWLDLVFAEELFEKIPEVSGVSTDPMSPGFQAPTGGGESEEPDPLPMARGAYDEAMEHFAERLQLDWQDADTRANVELIQRRLRRLDEIEDERRQDEGTDRSQDDPEQKDEQSDDSQESSGDKGAPSEEEPDESQESEDSEEKNDQEGEEQDSNQDTEQEAGDQDESPEEKENEDAEELHLTEEQMKRLEEQTNLHNKEGEALREATKGQGRIPTERDW